MKMTNQNDKIKIIPASEAGITNTSTTYLVNDYKGTVGLRHGRHEMKGSV